MVGVETVWVSVGYGSIEVATTTTTMTFSVASVEIPAGTNLHTNCLSNAGVRRMSIAVMSGEPGTTHG